MIDVAIHQKTKQDQARREREASAMKKAATATSSKHPTKHPKAESDSSEEFSQPPKKKVRSMTSRPTHSPTPQPHPYVKQENTASSSRRTPTVHQETVEDEIEDSGGESSEPGLDPIDKYWDNSRQARKYVRQFEAQGWYKRFPGKRGHSAFHLHRLGSVHEHYLSDQVMRKEADKKKARAKGTL